MKKQQASNRIPAVLPPGFKTMPERSADLDLKEINRKLDVMRGSSSPTQSAAYIDHGCNVLHAFVKRCLNGGLRQISVRVIGKKKEGDGSCGCVHRVAYATPGGSPEYFSVSEKCLDNFAKVVPERVLYEQIPAASRSSATAVAFA